MTRKRAIAPIDATSTAGIDQGNAERDCRCARGPITASAKPSGSTAEEVMARLRRMLERASSAASAPCPTTIALG